MQRSITSKPDQASSRRGFTIVELLIVIVVIAILAAITIVAYSGIQARARDATIRNAAAEVAKALQILAINQGQMPTMAGSGTTAAVSNGSCSGGGGGFANSSAYACTLEDMLVSTKLIPAGFISSLPSNTYIVNHSSMMYYPCSSTSHLLLWSLATPTTDDTANLNANMATCGYGTGLRDEYGMRASQIITF
jgi:prepilin-type N-terminal cleavage/methylation domain-containing protein